MTRTTTVEKAVEGVNATIEETRWAPFLEDCWRETGAPHTNYSASGATRSHETASRLSRIDLISRMARFYRDKTGSPEHGVGKRRWAESVVRLGPLTGIAAMFLALLSILASLGVLAVANDSPVASWPTPPSTFLAILTAVGNLSMRYAAMQGVIVAWWLKALHGSDLGRLHRDWRAGTSIRGAIAAGRQMGWLGLACIFSTLVVIDGPLLQRASTVTESSFHHPINLNSSMVPHIPRDYTGLWSNNTGSYRASISFNTTVPTPFGEAPNNLVVLLPTNNFDNVIKLWQEDNGYPGIITGCVGRCSAKLIAPAVAASACVTHSIPTTYEDPIPAAGAVNILDGKIAPPLSANAFTISTSLVVEGQREKVNAVTGFATVQNCSGIFNYTVCALESAVGEYDVTIQGESTTLDSAAEPRILSVADSAPYSGPTIDGDHLSTLAGVVLLMEAQWDSFVSNQFINGSIVTELSGTDSSHLFVVAGQNDDATCAGSYNDPRTQYMASMNKLMVYFGMAATRGQIWAPATLPKNYYPYQVNTTTAGYLIGQRSVFQTEYAFFAGAAVLELICICLVAPTYLGWWKIGRSVSFSPLEIAKAFEAPALADANSNAAGRDLAAMYKGRAVRYGATVARDNAAVLRIAFGPPSLRKSPEQDAYFDA